MVTRGVTSSRLKRQSRSEAASLALEDPIISKIKAEWNIRRGSAREDVVKVSSKTSDEDRQGKSWLCSGTSTKARQNVIESKVLEHQTRLGKARRVCSGRRRGEEKKVQGKNVL